MIYSNGSGQGVHNKGFTLLELLLALSILVSLLIIGASSIKKKDNIIKKTFRQFVALNRQLDHFARLKGQTWRLVIQMEEKESTWWVERQLPKNPMPSIDESTDSEEQPLPSDGFVIDVAFFEKPQKLPKNLKFESVELNNIQELVTDGKAYIYYFPEGQFSTAVLKIKGKKVYWSLFVDRLRGELTVYNGEKQLKDFKQ
ncbi:MAG: prepilin-type N-terminal cleavage/methylation domain-containing protein [Bdellovibrionales bacterium]|nr:prepilin-type N-terminal cleavage/methylation domain-containing protein [Bdellovibrionales bacterium]